MYMAECPRCNKKSYSASAKTLKDSKCYYCAYPLKETKPQPARCDEKKD